MGLDLWTMAELTDRVAGALSSGYVGQQSRRVTDVPDSRAIRYYTTLGLVDRPAAMRGRTALYGDRHLWQLVAIKRLQAEGQTLAEIQQRLAGASDATLRQLAAIPEQGFWRRTPAPPSPPPPPQQPQPEPLSVFQALPLDGGVVVLIPHRDGLTDDQIAALRAAAGPLLDATARLTKGLP